MSQTIDESRAQLIASLQQQADELGQLNRIAIALTSEFDLQRLLQLITDAARKVTAAAYAAFFLLPEIAGNDTRSSNKVSFNLAAIAGATERIEQHFRRLGPVEGIGLLEPVFWEGSSIVVNDVLQDARYVGIPRGHIPGRSFLGVQLHTSEGTNLGAFLIGHTQPNRFSTRHVELMEVLSAQAAVAIHNAQLVARERLAMETYAAHLEHEVRSRTAELEGRNQELNKFATDLQQLHHELTEAQKREMLADERSRIAQELHDRVQQTLFTMSLKANWVKEQLPDDSPLIRSFVVILTTFTDENLVARCIQAGARGYIVKDIERFDLKRSIRAVARGEAAIDSKAAIAVLAQLRRVPQVAGEAAPEPLSAQQLVILRLIAQGLSSREIATQLYLSENTVKGYVQEILHRLGVKNRTEAVMVAVKQGWL